MEEILYAGLIGAIVALMYGLIALPFKYLKKKWEEKAEDYNEEEDEKYTLDDYDEEDD
jgi:hypothetical protein